jgi:hypothetical protein
VICAALFAVVANPPRSSFSMIATRLAEPTVDFAGRRL